MPNETKVTVFFFFFFFVLVFCLKHIFAQRKRKHNIRFGSSILLAREISSKHIWSIAMESKIPSPLADENSKWEKEKSLTASWDKNPLPSIIIIIIAYEFIYSILSYVWYSCSSSVRLHSPHSPHSLALCKRITWKHTSLIFRMCIYFRRRFSDMSGCSEVKRDEK